MKINKKIIFFVFALIIIIGFQFVKKTIIYPRHKLTELKPRTSYKEIIWKFGKENLDIDIPFYTEGADIENRFIFIQDSESVKGNPGRCFRYYLGFNSAHKLCKLLFEDSWSSEEKPILLYGDARGPRFYKEEITNAKEKLGRLALGTKYEKIKKEFGEPDYIKPGENTVVYKVDDKKCYLLGFSESKKLNQLDIYESYEISSDGNVTGERTFLACDIRIK